MGGNYVSLLRTTHSKPQELATGLPGWSELRSPFVLGRTHESQGAPDETLREPMTAMGPPGLMRSLRHAIALQQSPVQASLATSRVVITGEGQPLGKDEGGAAP